jgi:hypothetical protein
MDKREQVAKIICNEVAGQTTPNNPKCYEELAEAIDKIYNQQVCPECCGRKVTECRTCPRCNGTGSIPVKWVRLAEDQSLPLNPLNKKEALNWLYNYQSETYLRCMQVYDKAQQDMLEAGWHKINPEEIK